MDKQLTFTDVEYNNRKVTTSREIFLDGMEKAIDFNKWCDLIRPYYYDGKRGRPPIDLETILRMYLLQTWYKLSDEGVEEAIYDSYAFRKFMGIDFNTEQVPDATTLLKFRHLMTKYKLEEALFASVNKELEAQGKIYRGGSIVDATIIDAPKSTKNTTKERDPEMHQTKKGNQWYFGCKMHIGVDAQSGMVHTMEITPANTHDIDVASKLIREDDDVVYADSGYLGIEKREEIVSDEHLSSIDYKINLRPSQLKIPDSYPGINWDKLIEHQKSSVRSKVEHVMHIVKRIFGYAKVVYRGLEKNASRLYMLLTSANLLLYQRTVTGNIIPI